MDTSFKSSREGVFFNFLRVGWALGSSLWMLSSRMGAKEAGLAFVSISLVCLNLDLLVPIENIRVMKEN